jgi:hypothetical protein
MSKQNTAKAETAADDTALVRIKHVKFVTVGLTLGSVREALDQLAARATPDVPNGYDIWLDEEHATFRFDYYTSNQLTARKKMPLARVEHFEEWDQPPSSAA